jgi:hypothetical protein
MKSPLSKDLAERIRSKMDVSRDALDATRDFASSVTSESNSRVGCESDAFDNAAQTTERVPASATLQEYEKLANAAVTTAMDHMRWMHDRSDVEVTARNVGAACDALNSWASRVVEERDARDAIIAGLLKQVEHFRATYGTWELTDHACKECLDARGYTHAEDRGLEKAGFQCTYHKARALTPERVTSAPDSHEESE